MRLTDCLAVLAKKAKSAVRDFVPIGRLAYSQEGEDLVLARIFDAQNEPGFYVDIGAHHPTRFSNTYFFYRKGWRGICVDAMPGTARTFRRMRPRDIAVECGIGVNAGVQEYFMFNEPALNTFSAEEANEKSKGPYRVTRRITVPVMPLRELLTRYLPKGSKIDFMTIDTEGLDYDVILSNDWDRFRPSVVAVELLGTTLQNVTTDKAAILLNRHGYQIFAKTCNTFFFVDESIGKQWVSTPD